MTATELALNFIRNSGKPNNVGKRWMHLFSCDYAAWTGLRDSNLPLTAKQASYLASLASKRQSGWQQIQRGYEYRLSSRVWLQLIGNTLTVHALIRKQSGFEKASEEYRNALIELQKNF